MKPSLLYAVGFLLFASTAHAQDSLHTATDSMAEDSTSFNRNNIRFIDLHAYSSEPGFSMPEYESESQINPTYLNVCPTSGLWKQGWFLGATAAASAFVGNPIGCEDLFGRIKPAFQINLGKWIIPSFGIRLQYQGMELANGEIVDQEYHSMHADMMLDVAALCSGSHSAPRISVIPFVGSGIMKNIDADTHTFSLHYGIAGSLMLSRHFHLNLELSGTDTFRNFDGIGSSSSLGDQLFSASIGLSYTIGNGYGRHRVIDASPFVEQNDRLMRRNHELNDNSRYLLSELSERDRALKEYRKILEIRGWLSQASDSSHMENPDKNADRVIGYPYNNYSGLNSLLNRLHTHSSSKEGTDSEKWHGRDSGQGSKKPGNSGSTATSGNEDRTDYDLIFMKGKACIGAPILFFFRLNSTRLTDASQNANLKEIASVAGKYNLMVRITGAADSATGSMEKNRNLSAARAEYISMELQKMGIRSDQIHCEASGGISTYSPSVANRNTRVELYLQK